MKNTLEAGRDLANAWMSANEEDFFALVEDAIDGGNPHTIVMAASHALPMDTRLDFVEDILSASGEVGVRIEEDGVLKSGNVRLFSFAVNARAGDIAGLLAPEGRALVARALGEARVIHKDAAVFVCPFPIEMSSAVTLDAGRCRRLTTAMIAPLFGGDLDLEGLRAQVDPFDAPEPHPDDIVSRIVVGVRLTLSEDPTADYIDDHPLEGTSRVEIDETLEWFDRRASALSQFKDVLETLCARRGLDVVVSSPDSFRRTLDNFAVMFYSNRLALEAVHQGLVFDGPFDVHVALLGDETHIAASRGATILGPVGAPADLMSLGGKGMKTWLEGRFDNLYRHGSIASILSICGLQAN